VLPEAERLPDMAAALARIEEAIESGEPILVHGDYDVDGITSAALLQRGLGRLGAQVEAFVPHRTRDGYDLGPAGLQRARGMGARLIITTDCGMTAMEAIEEAGHEGIDVVVTDHHRPGLRLPPAVAVVNPHRADSEYRFTGLTGVGVAFKLLAGLYGRAGRSEGELNRDLDLVAIGTIADRGPLVAENRALVRAGLRVLARSRNVGLRSLMDLARVTPHGGRVQAEDVGFRLAPRLNAAGRIGAAEDALRLLITDESTEAEELAWTLENHNRRRRSTDRQVLEEAEKELLSRFDPEKDRAIVLWSDGWHPGVIGIVASKLAERLGRPTVLISLEGDSGRGSARSAGGVNLVEVLDACADLLDRYGGHRDAAGFDIQRSRLEEFAALFVATVGRIEQDDGASIDLDLEIDLELTVQDALASIAPWMRHLEPLGDGNPRPVLLARAVRLEDVSEVGSEGGHLRAAIVGPEGGRLAAIGFGLGDRVPELSDGLWDVTFELVEDFWRDRRRLQARLLDAHGA
jgi:single-stranded-DNA-specific exonuclease